jgi:hypothetical protein
VKERGEKLRFLPQVLNERDIFLLQPAVGFIPAWEIGAHPYGRLDSQLYQFLYCLDHE